MNRKPITENDRQALSDMLDDGFTYKEMASYMEVCTDTLKRILVREGLAEFDGAKYAVAPSHKSQQKTWERACLKCRKSITMPKWQYVCDKCKSHNESQGIADEYIFSDVSDSTPMTERLTSYRFHDLSPQRKARKK